MQLRHLPFLRIADVDLTPPELPASCESSGSLVTSMALTDFSCYLPKTTDRFLADEAQFWAKLADLASIVGAFSAVRTHRFTNPGDTIPTTCEIPTLPTCLLVDAAYSVRGAPCRHHVHAMTYILGPLDPLDGLHSTKLFKAEQTCKHGHSRVDVWETSSGCQ